MKFCFTLFLLLIFFRCTMAQSDTVSLFHQSINAEALEKAGTYKNALHLNLMQIARGGMVVDYERLLGNSRCSVFGGVGFSVFDRFGQYYFRELSYYYEYGGNVGRRGNDLRGVWDIGFKCYTNKVLGNAYIGASFTTIANTVQTSVYKTNDGTVFILPVTKKLDYRSNEFKLLFGFSNDASKKFYHDISIGIGFRFISYQRYNYRLYANQNDDQPDTKAYYIQNKTNQTPWIFIYWKMGRRF